MLLQSSITIEVCVDSVESAQIAVRAGANRLEVCSNLGVGGGTTPSIGLVQAIKATCPGVPLMAMVRPRTGDFLYSATETDVMFRDIEQFAGAGVAGVVFGALRDNGSIDVEKTKQLVNSAFRYGLEVCFHRAFDMTRDHIEALKTIASIKGIARILTSGGGPSAPASLDTLQRLFSLLQSSKQQGQISGGLSLMPGSGINAATVGPLLTSLLPLGLDEIHLSGGQWIYSKMTHRAAGMGMGVGGDGEWGVWKTSEEKIREVRRIVDDHSKDILRETPG